jgi:ankyrin repeat protein
MIAACGRGDAETARRLATPDVLRRLEDGDIRVITDAASDGRFDVVDACVQAGLPVNVPNEFGATPLHQAAIRGRAALVRALLRRGADFLVRYRAHDAPALGWACFGADFVTDETGDYEATVAALLDAGAPVTSQVHRPEHAGVRRVLQEAGWLTGE